MHSINPAQAAIGAKLAAGRAGRCKTICACTTTTLRSRYFIFSYSQLLTRSAAINHIPNTFTVCLSNVTGLRCELCII